MDFATLSSIRGARTGKFDARPCLCCDRPVFGPVDRIHSFCDQACFSKYWLGRAHARVVWSLWRGHCGPRLFRTIQQAQEALGC